MAAESLYTPLLIQYSKESAYSEIPSADNRSEFKYIKGENPVCGDSIEWYVQLENDIITDIRYNVAGCLISKASAGLLTILIQGKSIHFFETKHEELIELLSDSKAPHPSSREVENEHWLALAQVKDYPARQKCALMAWNSLSKLIRSS